MRTRVAIGKKIKILIKDQRSVLKVADKHNQTRMPVLNLC